MAADKSVMERPFAATSSEETHRLPTIMLLRQLNSQVNDLRAKGVADDRLYHELAKLHHPDKPGKANDANKSRLMQLINERFRK